MGRTSPNSRMGLCTIRSETSCDGRQSKSSANAILQPASPRARKVHSPSSERNGPSTRCIWMRSGRSRVLRVEKLCVMPARRRSRRAVRDDSSRASTADPAHQANSLGYASTSLTRSNITAGVRITNALRRIWIKVSSVQYQSGQSPRRQRRHPRCGASLVRMNPIFTSHQHDQTESQGQEGRRHHRAEQARAPRVPYRLALRSRCRPARLGGQEPACRPHQPDRCLRHRSQRRDLPVRRLHRAVDLRINPRGRR